MTDRVEVASVVVGTGGGRELIADLYRPPSPNGAAALLIHGGGFANGDRRQLRGYGIALGRAGYTSLACEYRLAGEATWPAQIDDVHTALGYLHEAAGPLGLDPDKVLVSGNSAGGCLALLAAGMGEWPVAAAVAFYAPVDFLGADARAKGVPDAMRYLLGDDVSEARLRAMSPLAYVRESFPATLLITGNRDELVDSRESVRMYEALRAVGADVEIHVFDGAPHAFDLVPEFGRQCAAIVSLFVDTHVLSPRKIEVPSS